jgi:polysaccharide biosynthesis protein PslG
MRYHYVWICSVILVMGQGMAFGGGENPVQNSGFEAKDLSTWQFAAMGGAKAVGEVDTKVFHGGKKSFRITNRSGQGPNVFCMVSQDLQVKPNTMYEFSIWSKGVGVGNAWVGGGPGWALRVRFPGGTFDWQKFSGTFLTGPKETRFNFIVAVESTTEKLWLDDVVVTAGVTLEPEEYMATEKLLAPPEAVAPFLRSDFPDALGCVVFGFTQNPGELEQFAATGVKIVRTDLQWAEAEPQKGKFDEGHWKLVKGWVDSYARHGIRMLFILDYGNPAYGGVRGEMPKTKERRVAFARFAAEAARQFKGRNVLFELWNEPDGAVTAEEYMALAKVTIPAMRKANPNVVIIGPAAHHYATVWIEKCLKYGLLNLFDAVSIHLYFGMPPQPQPMPELNSPIVEGTRKLVAQYAHGRVVPIVNSEWGYKRQVPSAKPEDYSSCVSTRDNAKYLPRVFLLSKLWDLKFNVWFCWWLPDASIKGDGDYGLVTPDLIPMPSYYAMQTLARQLPKGHFKRRIEVGSKDDYVLEFDTAAGTRWAVWTVGKEHPIAIPVGELKKVKVTDLTGTRSFWVSADKPGIISLPGDGAVQYLGGE